MVITRSRSRTTVVHNTVSTMMMLPNELVIDIFTRLLGKEVGRSKCVCKYLHSIIESQAFSETYQNRQRCLMLYSLERINGESSFRHYFYYSPLRKLTDHNEGFMRLPELPTMIFSDVGTQLVNGLICVGKREMHFESEIIQFTIYNVFTREAMMIPKSMPYTRKKSTFHFGYDSPSRTYKLLRLIFKVGARLMSDRPPRANILTLKPSSSVSKWKRLKQESLICNFPHKVYFIYFMMIPNEGRTFFGDGFLYWFWHKPGLILFDVKLEKFHWAELPVDVKDNWRKVIPRAKFNGTCLYLSIWVLPTHGNHNHFVCFVREENEGQSWSRKYCIRLPEEMVGLGVATGWPSSTGDEEILLMNSRAIYSLNTMERSWFGKLPNKPLDLDLQHCSRANYYGFNARLFSLPNSNVVYLPLDHVLDGLV